MSNTARRKSIRMQIGASLALLVLAGQAAFAQAANVAQARFQDFIYTGINPDPYATGDKRAFRNPVLGGFYPDPSITRVGDDFYLVTSTFSYFPGIPVFHSKNLADWTQIGNAIDRPSQLDFGKLGLSRGVFAPTIEFHAGRFFIFNTCVDCGGNFMITANDPKGPWSDPVWLPDLEGGIDPGMFVDEDGRAYLVNNGPPDRKPEYDGHRAIWIQEFDLTSLKTFGPRKVLVDGGVDFSKKPIWIEGPHILKKDGWYYLICAEGGTSVGHSQVALRARSPWGPYAPNPANPILTQRDLDPNRPFPVTSAGHADLVQYPDGSWWATFLAVRPYEGNHYNTGREVFLLPVEWRNGWPSILEPGLAIPRLGWKPGIKPPGKQKEPSSAHHFRAFGSRNRSPASSDAGTWHERFERPLGPEWMVMRNPRSQWWRVDKGELVLEARDVGLGDFANPSFIARRQSHMAGSAEVHLTVPEPGVQAGLAVLQNDEYYFALALIGQKEGPLVQLFQRAGPNDPTNGKLLASVRVGGPKTRKVRLKTQFANDQISFSAGTGGRQSIPVATNLDARSLSTQTAGGFVGATIGMFARTVPVQP